MTTNVSIVSTFCYFKDLTYAVSTKKDGLLIFSTSYDVFYGSFNHNGMLISLLHDIAMFLNCPRDLIRKIGQPGFVIDSLSESIQHALFITKLYTNANILKQD